MTAPAYGARDVLKERLEIPATDETRDASLDAALAAASRGIDRATGRRFWLDEQPVARTYNPHGRVVHEPFGDLLLIDDVGTAEGLIVEIGSGASYTALTAYETAPDNALQDDEPVTGLLLLNGAWGMCAGRVRVTARFGWPVVPDDVAEAAMIQAARLFRRRSSPEGVTGSAEWGVVRLSRRDPDVWNLIEPYVLPGFG